MANRMTAIGAYRPRLKLNRSVGADELAKYISRGTALNRGEIRNVLTELHDAIVYFNSQGTPVHIEDVGYFTPSIRLTGNLNVNLRLDPAIRHKINLPGIFSGEILNGDNIGLAQEDLIAIWNAANPEDPVEA